MISDLNGGGVHRRHFLRFGVGVAGLLGLAGCVSTQDKRVEQQRTYVLVHGAWHGGWCWRDVRLALEKHGHRVYTPTLTGLGARAHLMSETVSLQTHIQDVIGLIEAEELDSFILVGHSYGGMVITGVADALKDRIQHIVYLDAALPSDGQSMLTQGPLRAEAETAATEQALRAFAPDGIAMAPPPPEIFGIDPSASDQINWLKRRLTPHPLRTWFDEIQLPNDGAEGLSATYILCTEPMLENTSFEFHADRLRTRPMWQVLELPTGHDAMVSAPDAVVDILMAV